MSDAVSRPQRACGLGPRPKKPASKPEIQVTMKERDSSAVYAQTLSQIIEQRVRW
jgi:hypothetical protein